MDNNFVFLAEKEEMWARMLMDVLEDNGIPCTAFPVYGVGLVIKTGKTELYRVFVPTEKFEQASQLMEEVFGVEGEESF